VIGFSGGCPNERRDPLHDSLVNDAVARLNSLPLGRMAAGELSPHRERTTVADPLVRGEAAHVAHLLSSSFGRHRSASSSSVGVCGTSMSAPFLNEDAHRVGGHGGRLVRAGDLNPRCLPVALPVLPLAAPRRARGSAVGVTAAAST